MGLISSIYKLRLNNQGKLTVGYDTGIGKLSYL